MENQMNTNVFVVSDPLANGKWLGRILRFLSEGAVGFVQNVTLFKA